MKKTISVLMLGSLLLALSASSNAAEAEKKITDPLEANVTYKVNWDVDQGGTVSKGYLNITIKGLLRHNKEWSTYYDKDDEPGKELKPGMITYAGQDLRATYRYEEKIIQKAPPEGCDELLAEYSGYDVVDLRPIESPGNLLLHYLGEIYGQLEGYQALVPSKVKPLLNDYYEFFLEAKQEKITGRRRGYNDCEFKEDSKTLPIGMIGIRYLFDESGRMRGHCSWNSKQKSGAPTFGVRVSNLPKTMEKKPFSPEQGSGPVTYTLSWNIKEPLMVNLERKIKGKWSPLTEDLREVIVGERVELRGVVIPADKDPGAGQWEIDGNDNQNYLKEFEANSAFGHVVPLNKEDLTKNSVVFYWYKGETGKVKYTVNAGGETMSDTAIFTIKRPDFDVTWDAGRNSHFGTLMSLETIKEKFPEENWSPETPYEGESGKGILEAEEGLEYDGILFICENRSDIKGVTEWVQLIEEHQSAVDDGENVEMDPFSGLDNIYPCAVGDRWFDAPALPITKTLDVNKRTFWSTKMDFDLYLMFMPEGEGNEWVPLKMIEWGWEGAISRPTLRDPWQKTMSRQPYDGEDGCGEPIKHDCDEYPEWTRNSADL